MTEREKMIYDFMIEKDIQLNEVLDVVVESNGIVGVGLISFAQDTKKYIEDKIRPLSEGEWNR